jgi:hypothetical protein
MPKSVATKSNNKNALTLVHSTPAPQSVIDKLSGSVLSDLAAHYETYGKGIFDQMLKTNPTAYFNSLIQLAKIVRIDLQADIHHNISKPKSIQEILDRVEQETGPVVRAAFEKFLKKIEPPTAG